MCTVACGHAHIVVSRYHGRLYKCWIVVVLQRPRAVVPTVTYSVEAELDAMLMSLQGCPRRHIYRRMYIVLAYCTKYRWMFGVREFRKRLVIAA